ncbi:MAG: lipopolysaccharide transport periplasmic protein LptA [Acidihalobacter sp.]|jgi:lipopolysaccharide export system protein LptA|uniref:lipopolysaccharide transport periplasmic protein LptA n=1 Tax=Acidihalobacter sp. TaxID=1872108 RepID=UPI00307DF537
MRNDLISPRLLLTTALFCLAPLPAAAQTPAAPEAPVHISADHFRFNQQKGTGNYSGNVVVTQDKLMIKGDKLDILAPNSGPIQKLTMIGTPATFEDTTAEGKRITGQAKNMVYNPAEQSIVLTGDAQLQQRGNAFRASRIVYDIRRDLVDAGAPGQRIEATYTPATGKTAETPKQ